MILNFITDDWDWDAGELVAVMRIIVSDVDDAGEVSEEGAEEEAVVIVSLSAKVIVGNSGVGSEDAGSEGNDDVEVGSDMVEGVDAGG